MIKNFSDIFILAELRNGPLSGYDVIEYIHNKFRILVSSGTVYSILYSLERRPNNWQLEPTQKNVHFDAERRRDHKGNSEHKRQDRVHTIHLAQTAKEALKTP